MTGVPVMLPFVMLMPLKLKEDSDGKQKNHLVICAGMPGTGKQTTQTDIIKCGLNDL